MLLSRRTLLGVALAVLAALFLAAHRPAAASARARTAGERGYQPGGERSRQPSGRHSRRLSGRHSRQPNAAVRIGTARVSGLGMVLVRGSGHPLYAFQPTTASEPGCTPCGKIWFPLLAPARGDAKAVGSAKQSLIGDVMDPVIHRRVVTYNGWPLYTYVLDKTPDIATGQGILMGGGYWRVLTPAGKVDRKAVSHGGGYVGS